MTTHNGVEALIQIAAALPEQIIASDVVKVVGLNEDSGAISDVSSAGTVVVGDLDGRSGSTPKVRAADGAVQADVAESGLAERWTKLIYVAPFDGLGVVKRATRGELRSPAWRHALNSLHGDSAAAHPADLDAWSGAIVRLGNQSDRPPPVNLILHQLLAPRSAP